MTKKTPHKSHFENEFDELKDHLIHVKDSLIEHVVDVADAAQKSEEKLVESIEAHPLVSLGLAAAIGFIFGLLVTRK